eukprot:6406280-Amphidinium_carterae.1
MVLTLGTCVKCIAALASLLGIGVNVGEFLPAGLFHPSTNSSWHWSELSLTDVQVVMTSMFSTSSSASPSPRLSDNEVLPTSSTSCLQSCSYGYYCYGADDGYMLAFGYWYAYYSMGSGPCQADVCGCNVTLTPSGAWSWKLLPCIGFA